MPDRKYMTFEDIRLQTPLLEVKRTTKERDSLVIPENFLEIIEPFLKSEGIEYHVIENTELYPVKMLEDGLKRYDDLDPAFVSEEPIILITPFDAEDLFEWTKQLCENTMDPSYRQYLEDSRAACEDYYYKYESE